MMKARKGRIISIASVIGVTGNAGQANYAAAKAGIIAFSQIAGPGDRQPRHHRQRGRARLHRHRHDPGAARGRAKDAMQARSPWAASAQPADIAEAVAFLAGPAAAYITGETLHVNGGMYMA